MGKRKYNQESDTVGFSELSGELGGDLDEGKDVSESSPSLSESASEPSETITDGSASEASAEGEAGSEPDAAPKSTDEKAEPVESAHTPAEQEPSQSETLNAEPAIEAKDEPEAEPASAEPASEPLAFGDLRGDVSELAEHLSADALGGMKAAGDALTPAVSALHGIEEKLEHLGDEAKARFVHAKTMLVNAMGALERLFERR